MKLVNCSLSPSSSSLWLRLANLCSIYTWADYVDPDLVAAFEAANSCRVSIDTFDSNEAMYAKLKAGGAGTTSSSSSYQIALLRSQR